jgi:hypothetical protein
VLVVTAGGVGVPLGVDAVEVLWEEEGALLGAGVAVVTGDTVPIVGGDET